MPVSDLDGPSLNTYVETRFNLLTEVLKSMEGSNKEAITTFIVSTAAALQAVKTATENAQLAMDLRYQQRFEAQSDALAAAFLSQQTAMQTAFIVAEKAVQAALAAADRAVSKAELAADKRFEALNELRQMLNDMVASLITRLEAIQRFDAMSDRVDAAVHRIEILESRFNLMVGGQEGKKETRVNTRADSSKTLQILGAIMTFIALVVILWKLSVGR